MDTEASWVSKPFLLLQLLACFRMESCDMEAQYLIFVIFLQENILPASREKVSNAF